MPSAETRELIEALRSGGEAPIPERFRERTEWLRVNWALRQRAADALEAALSPPAAEPGTLAPVSPQPVAEPVGFVQARATPEEPWGNPVAATEIEYLKRVTPNPLEFRQLYAHPDAQAEQRGRLAGIEEAAKVALAEDPTRAGKYLAERIRALIQPQESSL